MNLKSTTLFVALIFCAAPALADRILPMDPQNGENVSHHTQQWIHGKASAIRFDSEDTKMAEVVVLEESHLNTDDTQVNLFTLGLNEGYAFGRNNDDGNGRGNIGRRSGRSGSWSASRRSESWSAMVARW